MELTTVWFSLIAVLWIGYFTLEGFDFGVGMLLPVLAQDETERRVMINTIGPVWDGNEVWVLVAGGATFAAFPEWYATLFSGFYLPLLLILVALIVRGVAFEYRGKRDDDAWRRSWDTRPSSARYLPALLWGVAFANIVAGVPIDADKEFTGNLFTLLNPYGLLGGLVTLTAVPHPRRDVPRAQDRRRHPAPGPRAGGQARPGRRRGRRRLPRLDPGEVRLGARAAGALRRGRRRAARLDLRGDPGPRGLGLHRHLRRDRAARWPGCSGRCSRT